MANELYFIFSEIAEQDKAIEFLTSRPNYKAEAKQLSYDNPDTDASFTVEFGGRLVGEDDIPEIDGPFLNFRINYLRPEIYLDEVSTELEIYERIQNKVL